MAGTATAEDFCCRGCWRQQKRVGPYLETRRVRSSQPSAGDVELILKLHPICQRLMMRVLPLGLECQNCLLLKTGMRTNFERLNLAIP